MAKKKGTIPKHELEALAEVIFPTMKDYLTSPEGKAAFGKWKAQQKQKKSKRNTTNEG